MTDETHDPDDAGSDHLTPQDVAELLSEFSDDDPEESPS